jgi:ABC-type branched-subunit amino acid transport system substrate-binding protein
MTSVQNRLRLLNGNNLLVFFIIIAGISSCASKKITTTKNVEVVAIQTKENNKEPNFSNTTKAYEDSISKKPVIFDLDNNSNQTNTTNTNTNTSVKNTKPLNNDENRVYNVAVILPFNLSQIPLGQYADDTTKQLGVDSKNAMEFYLGCQMAREKFESEHLKTNVYFLDDKNDSLTMVSLFKQKPFPNVDYIIGPLYFKNLKTAADLAKNNQIPLVSPLANSMYIRDNPYYFNAVGSVKAQYSFIFEQTKAKFPSKTLEVIYDGQDSTAESIEILKSVADKYYDYAGIKYTSLQAWSDASKSMAWSDTLSERIILIYSSKDSYIKSVIAKLKPIKNHLQIFTSSAAKDIKALVDAKNPHSVYTVFPFNSSNPNYSFFAAKYEDKHKKKASETSCQAYDLMMHLFYLLDKNQALQDNVYNYSADFDNTQTKFQFKSVLNKNGELDYYDNTFLYLYKYLNGTFVIATP